VGIAPPGPAPPNYPDTHTHGDADAARPGISDNAAPWANRYGKLPRGVTNARRTDAVGYARANRGEPVFDRRSAGSNVVALGHRRVRPDPNGNPVG
jgi:hypothetical protein